jgi:hypothetical protein
VVAYIDNEIHNTFYGKIDFYSMKGEVMESLYYEDKEEFDKEINDSYEIGRPIHPQVLVEDKQLDEDYDEEMELE